MTRDKISVAGHKTVPDLLKMLDAVSRCACKVNVHIEASN